MPRPETDVSPSPPVFTSASDLERGQRIARLLRGAWRGRPPSCDLSEADLSAILTPLLRSGSAPLAWWVVRNGALRASAVARTLHDVYALAAVQATLREEMLRTSLLRLQTAGLRPVLGKGWVAAGLYPERGLRPFGDFDFYAPRAQAAAVKDALVGVSDIDVHVGFAQLDDREETEVLARTRAIDHAGLRGRAFSAEDHLRLLCLHFLGHGGWRPAWLCDIGAALEGGAGPLDWDWLLSGDARRTDWTICTLVLASHLLEAPLADAPARVRERRLPRWLVSTVLRQWGAPDFEAHGRRTPLSRVLLRPAALVRGLRIRWPNAVEASVGVQAPFNGLPRFPIRVAESVRRSLVFTSRLLKGKA